MPFRDRSVDGLQCNLAEGYSLERAAPEEYAIYPLLYHNVDLHLDPSWETRLSIRAKSVRHPFWIVEGDHRIGRVHAQSVYTNLGFLPGVETSTLHIPAR